MAASRSSQAKAKKSASKRAATPEKKLVKKAAAVAVKAPAKLAKVNGKTKTLAPVAPAKPIVVKKPVETKPRKLTSPLSKSELTHFRALLLEKRRELLGDVGTMENEAFKSGSNLSNMPIHMADVGTDNFEQEFTLGLIESERKLLREIQDALGRIEEGTFGICIGTGKAIPKVRLEAVPWAKYTIEYSKALESGAIRRDGGSDDEDNGSDDDEE
ncbi:MAG: TraR/DksA C4-type zinc finger protein [Phycisphaerae bacterium]